MLMKKILLFILFYGVWTSLWGQPFKADSLLKVISVSTNDSLQINAITDLLDLYESHSADSNMIYARKILQIGQDRRITTIEAFGYAEIGYAFYRMDSKAKGYEYVLKALKIAEWENKPRVLANMYLLMGNFKTGAPAIADYKKAIAFWETVGDPKHYGYNNLSRAYRQTGQYDSALIFGTKAYEVALHANYDVIMPYILLNLGETYEGLKNPVLALTYYRLALDDARSKRSNRLLWNAYKRLADYYKNVGIVDSSFFYSKKAYESSISESIGWVIIPSYSLYEIYAKKNKTDSALKYLHIYTSAKDSLNTIEELNKMQSLAFEEDLRQKELAAEKKIAQEERRRNLQYASIALGVITFLVLFFVLSHSIIVNERWVRFFGILGLLLVFELINLFIHPYLAHATNDSPLLMLVALVCIAALLIPAHHRIEHWITHRLVEKNKKIRLAAAKKTIQQLDTNPVTS